MNTRTVRDDGSSAVRATARAVTALLVLPAALLVATAQAAAAEAPSAAEASVPFSLAGPVGIVAVIIGFGGLVVGLFRRHRVEVAAKLAAVAEPVPVLLPEVERAA